MKVERQAFSPQLTFSDEEANFIGELYQSADQILEYGSGASTLLAQDLSTPVVSVESDKDWAKRLQTLIGDDPATQIYYVNIGPTRKWGYPEGNQHFRSYANYASRVWDDLPKHPDVVLIDGRFRLACFATTLYQLQSETIVVFDDYVPRIHYHIAEQLQKPTFYIGKMAIFHCRPTRWNQTYLSKILNWFADPR